MADGPRILLLTTTGGAFLNETLKRPGFRGRVFALLSDREPGLAAARRHGLRTALIEAPENAAFSDRLLDFAVAEGIDYIVTASFRRLLAGALLARYRGRLFNLHPSLLPAFAGLNPMDKSLASDTRVLGNTVHLIDESVDGGAIIMQSVLFRRDGDDEDELRHRVFEQLCKGLIQLVAWLWQERLEVGPGGVRIRGAHFDDPAFCPGLDDTEATALALPYPWWELAEYRALAARLGKPTSGARPHRAA